MANSTPCWWATLRRKVVPQRVRRQGDVRTVLGVSVEHTDSEETVMSVSAGCAKPSTRLSSRIVRPRFS